MTQLVFDESLAEQLEVVYRTRDVLRRRALIRRALDVQPGERVLDVGCGPGFYVAELLEEVGSEGSVVGVDNSAAMLAVAAHRCEGRRGVSFHEADVLSLPVESASFDRALCVQVLEYVEDVEAALAEVHRALRPGGRLVVWDVDWETVSWHSSDPDRMARVLRAWDAHLAHPSLPRTLTARLRAAGFEQVRMEGHTFATNRFDSDSYGGALVPVLERYVAGRGEIDDEELQAWVADQRQIDERGEFYFVCVQFGFTATKPRSRDPGRRRAPAGP
jgi:SAM-dependent methyltransferase